MLLTRASDNSKQPASQTNMLARQSASPAAASAATKPAAARPVARAAPRAARAPRHRRALAATGGDNEGGEDAPTTSGQKQPDQAPLPPWVRAERERDAAAASGSDKSLPWPLYLVFSFLVATAAVGSIFEYANKNAVFGVLQPDSPLWAPVLGLFAFTGLPTAAALFFKGVAAANASFEAQDKADGYIE